MQVTYKYNSNTNKLEHLFVDLFCMIMDLLKTAKFALDGIEVSTESAIHTERYVGSLLRIIEMLIPLEEAELLDILYRKYLNEKNKSDSN